MAVHMLVPSPEYGTSTAHLLPVRARFLGGPRRDLHRVLPLRRGPIVHPRRTGTGGGEETAADRLAAGREPAFFSHGGMNG
jgi:hypothetical protein